MKLWLPILALALLAGCGSRAPNAPDDPIVIAHIGPSSSVSGLAEPERRVIRDAVSFVRAWRQAFGDAPIPMVDFGREMVIVAAMGARASGGYDIRVADVDEKDGRVVVRVVSREPGPGCVVTLMPTSPVDFALVTLVRGSVEFRDRTVVETCGN